jgi:hypothetical protein
MRMYEWDREKGTWIDATRPVSGWRKEGTMLRLVVAAASLALLFIGCANVYQPGAELIPGRIDEGQEGAYLRYSWTEAREIPENDPRGILVGPIVVDRGWATLGTVTLRLDIRHPDTGDLDIWLAYDADGDGTPEVRAPVEFFRCRLDLAAEELHAYPLALTGSYYFRDNPDGEETPFAPFRDLLPGRAFYLAVADTLAEDTGSLLAWSVYLR